MRMHVHVCTIANARLPHPYLGQCHGHLYTVLLVRPLACLRNVCDQACNYQILCRWSWLQVLNLPPT